MELSAHGATLRSGASLHVHADSYVSQPPAGPVASGTGARVTRVPEDARVGGVGGVMAASPTQQRSGHGHVSREPDCQATGASLALFLRRYVASHACIV